MASRARKVALVKAPEPKALPDLVYIVRPPAADESPETSHAELRHSLRSVAANAAGLFGKVWIVGTIPAWVRNVETLALDPQPEKFANITASVSAACHDDRVADEVVILNDDHFAIDPISSWDTYHLGPAWDYVAAREAAGTSRHRNTWLRAVIATTEWMNEHYHADSHCYEAHVPLAFNRAALATLLDQYPADRPCAYPAFYPVAGAAGEGAGVGNSKVKALDSSEFDAKLALPMPYLSTSDESFKDGVVGGFIRGLFRDPCQFEETP